MSTVQITTSVALAEQQALTEYYRNRSLIQAQAIADLQAQITALTPAPIDGEIVSEEAAE